MKDKFAKLLASWIVATLVVALLILVGYTVGVIIMATINYWWVVIPFEIVLTIILYNSWED